MRDGALVATSEEVDAVKQLEHGSVLRVHICLRLHPVNSPLTVPDIDAQSAETWTQPIPTFSQSDPLAPRRVPHDHLCERARSVSLHSLASSSTSSLDLTFTVSNAASALLEAVHGPIDGSEGMVLAFATTWSRQRNNPRHPRVHTLHSPW